LGTPTLAFRLWTASELVGQRIVAHESDDESTVYPRLSKYLSMRMV
jgi:hypothetical protein